MPDWKPCGAKEDKILWYRKEKGETRFKLMEKDKRPPKSEKGYANAIKALYAKEEDNDT